MRNECDWIWDWNVDEVTRPSSFCSSVWFGLRHWYVIVLSLSGQWTATKSADQIFNFFDFGSCPLTFYIGRAPCVLILDVPLLPLVVTLIFLFTVVMTLDHFWFIPLVVTLMFFSLDVTLHLWSSRRDPLFFLLWSWPFICGPLVVTLYFFLLWSWPSNIFGLSL